MQYEEGQTATNKEGKRIIFKDGAWRSLEDAPTPRPKTSSKDQQALTEASKKAQVERDVMREYAQAERAVEEMGTGPTFASYLDAITPDEDDGFFSTAGAYLASPLRWLVDDDTMEARDHLRTVNAQVALAASGDLKGPASDRDMGLMRMSGIGPYKTEEENKRIIRTAKRQSGLEQLRATLTSNWIGKYGSLSAPGENGWTFERYLQRGEEIYNRRMDNSERGTPEPPFRRSEQPSRSRMPSAPPRRKKRKGGEVTIDINGNEI